MNKSKSMAVAAAALAMCMAGSAFAQDGRFDRGPDRHDDRHDRYEQQQQHHRQGGPNNGHYQQRPQDFRPGPQYSRPAYPNPHVEWRRGGRVPSEYRSRSYVVNDWRGHRLHQPPRGYQWVGVGGDFVLAAVATGLIAQIIVGQ
ncbi:RcnB family protein [Variovorax sp. J2P1-59]|uniref:RcnB family protein n=1 Tax=Variovorax flavidus TaxID=3053501 RepID=UPI002575B5BF|nr:RcnB family protein [Variovorax sp. J2P1-59]MDM0075357.1 RcnB family protein [Variovorax sp. J2P1-59]